MPKPKFYFIYKTTNLVNGMFYIGKHETLKVDDGYLGSGNYLLNAIRKYGKENFKREILEFMDNRISLSSRELELVDDDFLNRNRGKCYNIVRGGCGGDARNFYRQFSPTIIAIKGAETLKSFPEKLLARNKKIGEKTKERYRNNPESFIGGVSNKGKKKETDEGIRRQLESRRINSENKKRELLNLIRPYVKEGKQSKNVKEIRENIINISSISFSTICRLRLVILGENNE